MRGYKKHDNKKLTASTRWAVEGLIFFCGWILTKAVPHGKVGISWYPRQKGGIFVVYRELPKVPNLFFQLKMSCSELKTNIRRGIFFN